MIQGSEWLCDLTGLYFKWLDDSVIQKNASIQMIQDPGRFSDSLRSVSEDGSVSHNDSVIQNDSAASKQSQRTNSPTDLRCGTETVVSVVVQTLCCSTPRATKPESRSLTEECGVASARELNRMDEGVMREGRCDGKITLGSSKTRERHFACTLGENRPRVSLANDVIT